MFVIGSHCSRLSAHTTLYRVAWCMCVEFGELVHLAARAWLSVFVLSYGAEVHSNLLAPLHISLPPLLTEETTLTPCFHQVQRYEVTCAVLFRIWCICLCWFGVVLFISLPFVWFYQGWVNFIGLKAPAGLHLNPATTLLVESHKMCKTAATAEIARKRKRREERHLRFRHSAAGTHLSSALFPLLSTSWSLKIKEEQEEGGGVFGIKEREGDERRGDWHWDLSCR